MAISRAEVVQSRTVRPKPIGGDGGRQVSPPFQQTAHDHEGRLPVPPPLPDVVENFA
jgi:hypothetical protein